MLHFSSLGSPSQEEVVRIISVPGGKRSHGLKIRCMYLPSQTWTTCYKGNLQQIVVNTFPHSGLVKFRVISNAFATLANQSLCSNRRDSVYNLCLSPFWTDPPISDTSQRLRFGSLVLYLFSHACVHCLWVLPMVMFSCQHTASSALRLPCPKPWADSSFVSPASLAHVGGEAYIGHFQNSVPDYFTWLKAFSAARTFSPFDCKVKECNKQNYYSSILCQCNVPCFMRIEQCFKSQATKYTLSAALHSEWSTCISLCKSCCCFQWIKAKTKSCSVNHFHSLLERLFFLLLAQNVKAHLWIYKQIHCQFILEDLTVPGTRISSASPPFQAGHLPSLHVKILTLSRLVPGPKPYTKDLHKV